MTHPFSPVTVGTPPFDAPRLDELMAEAGIDVLVATSKHNVQYLLGGYRFFFFDAMDAIGVSRYLPVMIYPRGRPDAAAYLGYPLEKHEKVLGRFWTPTTLAATSTSMDVMERAAALIQKLGGTRRVGIERCFLPADSESVLRSSLPNLELVDAYLVLERLRAIKTDQELGLIREASDRVVSSMVATFPTCKPGRTKYEVIETLRREEVSRGLSFDYCLMTSGTSLNRAPSDTVLKEGDIISLDSGGNYKGYIGDLCRMGIIGEPDSELTELLSIVDDIQQQTRAAAQPGRPGREIYDVAERMLSASPHRGYLEFVAHGMGLVSHEAPRLTAHGPVPYPDTHAHEPLHPGMVLSIETTMLHPRRGFVKLEDTVAITETGNDGFGDAARGWNRI